MNGDGQRDRLGPQAESHRKLAFDVAELRVHHLESNPAPRDLADCDGPVTEEERDAIAKHRADAVDTPAPRERRVTPTKPNLDGANWRLDRQSIPPSVVADAPDSFPRARDGAPPVPAPLNREFAAADEDPVAQDSELRLDDHALDIEAGLNKRSPGMPGRKPLSEGPPCGQLHAPRPPQPHALLPGFPRGSGGARGAGSEDSAGRDRDHGSQFRRRHRRGRASGGPPPPRESRAPSFHEGRPSARGREPRTPAAS